MRFRKVALILLFDGQKRVLLQDRRGISKLGEEWGFFGGGIEEGETPEQAVRRETREELRYELKEPRFVGRVTDTVQDLTIDRYVFAEPLEDAAQLTQLEGKRMAFFTLDAALKLKMVSDGDKEVLLQMKRFLRAE